MKTALALSLGAFACLIVACSSESSRTNKSIAPEKTDEALTKAQATLDRLHGKEIDVSTDEMDGTKTYTLELLASKGSSVLIMRCSSPKNLDIYIAVDEMVESNAYDKSSVRYKLDEGQPRQEWWGRSKDHRALFSPSPKPLLQLLGNGNSLMFEYPQFQGPRTVITFDLANLRMGIPKLTTACHLESLASKKGK